jgi:hypothetical protein
VRFDPALVSIGYSLGAHPRASERCHRDPI